MTPLYVRVFDADGSVAAKGEANLEAQPNGLHVIGWVQARADLAGAYEVHAFGPKFSVRFGIEFPPVLAGDRVDIVAPVTVGEPTTVHYAGAQTAQAQAAALS